MLTDATIAVLLFIGFWVGFGAGVHAQRERDKP